MTTRELCRHAGITYRQPHRHRRGRRQMHAEGFARRGDFLIVRAAV